MRQNAEMVRAVNVGEPEDMKESIDAGNVMERDQSMSDKEIRKRSVEAIMQLPGPLWKLSLLAKEVTEQDGVHLYLVGIEADRAINPDHALQLMELAKAMIKDQQWRRLDQ